MAQLPRATANRVPEPERAPGPGRAPRPTEASESTRSSWSARSSESAQSSGSASRRPGGRSALVRAKVLEAVRAELVEHGYDALSVDVVADRAGVHRTTVYRRWRDVGGLLADVLDDGLAGTWQLPDTGTLYGDLAALNAEAQAALTERPSLTAALIAASFRSEQAASALGLFWKDRYRRGGVAVERAAERGEIPSGTAARQVLVAATGPLYHHLVLMRGDPDPLLPERAARSAAHAAAAGVFAPDPGA